MRQQTDVLEDFPPHGQEGLAYTTSAPATRPQLRTVREEEPPTTPQRRVRPKPHRRYNSPSEMWSWHWARMRIVLSWTVVLVTCMITLTAGSVILSEFW